MAPIAHSGNDTRKTKRIGRKVGNLVAAMLGVSITLVVVLCVLMFYRLTMSMMQKECVSGTNVLAYELASYSGGDSRLRRRGGLGRSPGLMSGLVAGGRKIHRERINKTGKEIEKEGTGYGRN